MGNPIPKTEVLSAAELAVILKECPPPEWSPPFADGCWLCGHVYAQEHRIIPGCWGGDYSPENVAKLCPNHHAAIHLFMDWYLGGSRLSEAETKRMEGYQTDRELKRFWLMVVKPVVRQRMVAEGSWYPYQRTLPPPDEDKQRNKHLNNMAKWGRWKRNDRNRRS